MGQTEPLQQAKAIASALEQLADQLRPEVIRAARQDDDGRRDLDRIEYALGTIGKALILTDYSIDEEKDIDKLKAFRESQKEGNGLNSDAAPAQHPVLNGSIWR